MLREHLQIAELSAWMQLNNIELHGVDILHGQKGAAVTAVQNLTDQDPLLMRIPRELILTLDTVWLYAKSDQHLLEVLKAAGAFAKVLSIDLKCTRSACH